MKKINFSMGTMSDPVVKLTYMTCGCAATSSLLLVSESCGRKSLLMFMFYLLLAGASIAAAVIGHRLDINIRVTERILSVVALAVHPLMLALSAAPRETVRLWVLAGVVTAIVLASDRADMCLLALGGIISIGSFHVRSVCEGLNGGCCSPTAFTALLPCLFICVVVFVEKKAGESKANTCETENQFLSIDNNELNFKTYRDALLTQLYNRRFFDETLSRLMCESRESGTPLSLIGVDIDHFKAINDSYGHDKGDIALKALADTMLSSSREGDFCCRTGGEEFVIIVRCDVNMAAVLAERLREAVGRLDIPAIGGHITVSCGVAGYDGLLDAQKLYKLTDKMLYQAKQTGRNRVCVARMKGDVYEDDEQPEQPES